MLIKMQRDEKDRVTILSGTEFGKTLGTPIGLFVPNEDMRPGDYSDMRAIPRPSHADFTYMVSPYLFFYTTIDLICHS